MLTVAKKCSDEEFDGYRRTSDLAAKIEGSKILNSVTEKLKTYPHTSEMTLEQFTELTDIYSDAGLELYQICLPPNWTPEWVRP